MNMHRPNNPATPTDFYVLLLLVRATAS